MFDFMKASGKRDSIQGEEKSKFEAARNEVQALSLQAEAHTPVTRVSEKGKFLKIGSHKVTGKELNDIAAHIDNSTIQVRNVQIETLRHVDQLYQALDALEADHDYLTAGGVFPEHLITNFIKLKRKECMEMSKIPHPAEFDRYFNL